MKGSLNAERSVHRVRRRHSLERANRRPTRAAVIEVDRLPFVPDGADSVEVVTTMPFPRQYPPRPRMRPPADPRRAGDTRAKSLRALAGALLTTLGAAP